ncbi:MAG: hypothetical protein ACLSU0_08140, partial [Oscillospiraceae bacterium]
DSDGIAIATVRSIASMTKVYFYPTFNSSPKQGEAYLHSTPNTDSQRCIPAANSSAAARALKNLQGINFYPKPLSNLLRRKTARVNLVQPLSRFTTTLSRNLFLRSKKKFVNLVTGSEIRAERGACGTL